MLIFDKSFPINELYMTLRLNLTKFVPGRFQLLFVSCGIVLLMCLRMHLWFASHLESFHPSLIRLSLAPCGHTPCMSDKCANRAAGESPRSRPMHEKRQEALDPLASACICCKFGTLSFNKPLFRGSVHWGIPLNSHDVGRLNFVINMKYCIPKSADSMQTTLRQEWTRIYS